MLTSPEPSRSSCVGMSSDLRQLPGASRGLRALMTWWTLPPLLMMLLLLTGCGDRPEATVLAPRQVPDIAATGARQITAYAVTTRDRDPQRPYAFGNDRAHEPQHASFIVSVPPKHAPGAIEWPDGEPDPRTDFVTLRQQSLGREALLQRLGSAECSGGVGIFVHGYNHSFQEALYRLVQMSADANFHERPVLFAWPSGARALDYLGDRDAADASRRVLAELLTDVAQHPQIGPITVFAHSMGARLTMESLSQLRLARADGVLERLEVILVAPDIDLDVFREQIQLLGPMRTPLAVLVAPDDQALQVSRRLSGNRPRLGALQVGDAQVSAAAEAAGVQVIDIGSVPATRLAHDRHAALASLQLDRDGPHSQQQLPGPGTLVFDTIGRTLKRAVDSTTTQQKRIVR